MNGSIRTAARTAALALVLTALAVGTIGTVLAASPLESTAWHLVVDRDRTTVAGVGTQDWGNAEAMLFLLAGGSCRFDVYDPGQVVESIAPPSSCLANACQPCSWTGDAKGKRLTLRFSDGIARDLIVGNLLDIADEEGVDTTGYSFSLTKNKCPGVVKTGKLTLSWDIGGKVTVPAASLRNKSVSHQIRVSGSQVQ